MASKRATLNFDTSPFEELITKLDGLGGDVKSVVTDALEQAAETIEWDTKDAMQATNLPAKGEYSTGDTEKTIVSNSQIEWSGTMASINVGFDYGKNGAGGLLITGTPKMQPNRALNKIYTSKKYMKDIQNDIAEIVNDAIVEKMEGG